MRLPSGSKIGLAAKCGHPFNSGAKWPWSESGDAAQYGNALHRVCENHVFGVRETLADVAAEHSLDAEACGRLRAEAPHVGEYIDALARDGWLIASEVAIAYHLETGRARAMRQKRDSHGRPIHRDYSDRRAGEIVATVDLVAIDPRTLTVLVGDWKSGRPQEHDAFGTTWQMAFCGIAVAQWLGADEVDVALLYPSDVDVYEDRRTLDVFDLDAIAEGLRGVHANISQGPTVPVQGAHCTAYYCPLLGACSATQAALARVTGGESSSILARIDTDEAFAATVVRDLPAVKRLVEQMEKQVKARALKTPIDLGDGRVYGCSTSTREAFDARRSLPVLREYFGDDAEAMVMRADVTKEAMKKALGDKAQYEALLDDLRSAGAAHEYTRDEYKARKRRKEEEAA